MTIPVQCKDCMRLPFCEENGCFKNKPCAEKIRESDLEKDILREMEERRN